VWNDVTPRTALAPPSSEAKRHLSCASIDKTTSECLRTDNKGKVIDTTTALESGSDRYAKRGDGRRGAEEDTGKRKVAHERPRRERSTTSVARQTTTQQWGWGGGNGWYGAAAPTTTGWSYRW
jgi:hypothetical protein